MEKKEKNMFSENNDDHNFQTVHMENKLKNIKKRKVKKVKQNFKNIETFEVLTNTNENKKEKPIKKKDKKKETIIEGNTNIDEEEGDINDRNDRSMYEGHDDIEDPKGNLTWKEQISKFIKDAYSYIDLSRHIGDNLADVLSDGKAKEKDKVLLREFISYMMAALLSYPITYNWYFYVFYAKEQNIDILKCDPLKLREMVNPSESEEKQQTGIDIIARTFISIFLWFFEFVFWFPFTIEVIINLVNLIGNNISNPIKFVGLYFVVFIFIKFFFLIFKNVILGFLGNETNSYVIYAFVFLVVFLIFSYAFRATTRESIGDTIIAAPILILVILLRMLFVFIFTVPLAAFVILIYLVFYSLFPIYVYSKSDEIFTTFDNLHKDTEKIINLEEQCDPSTMQIIIEFVVDLIKNIKNYIHYIVTAIIASIFIFIFYFDMSNVDSIINGISLKEILIALSSILLSYPVYIVGKKIYEVIQTRYNK